MAPLVLWQTMAEGDKLPVQLLRELVSTALACNIGREAQCVRTMPITGLFVRLFHSYLCQVYNKHWPKAAYLSRAEFDALYVANNLDFELEVQLD